MKRKKGPKNEESARRASLDALQFRTKRELVSPIIADGGGYVVLGSVYFLHFMIYEEA